MQKLNDYFEKLILEHNLNLVISHDFSFDKNKPSIILLTGASGAGKDSVIEPFCNGITSKGEIIGNKDAIISRIITTTTREPREREDEMSYNFEKFAFSSNENRDQIIERAKLELNLIESSFHMGSIYGIPKTGIDVVRKIGIGLIRMEIFGAKYTHEILLEQGFNTIIISIQPKNIQELQYRIKKRQPDMSESLLMDRLDRARKEMSLENSLANFIIKNINGELEKSRLTFSLLIKTIIDLTKT
jgi:guanylate kinase